MRLGIGWKLALSFSVPLGALVLIVAALAVGCVRAQAANARAASLAAYSATAREAITEFGRTRYAIRGIALANAPADRAAYARDGSTLDRDRAKLRAGAALVPGILPDLDALDAALTAQAAASNETLRALAANRRAVLAAYDGRSHDATIVANLKEAKRAGHAVETTIATVTADANAAFDRAARESSQTLQQLLVIAFVAVGIAFAATFAAALVLARSMTRRLGAVSHAIRTIVAEDLGGLSVALDRLAAGDLRGGFTPARPAIGASGTDEIDDLVRSHDALVAGLGTIGTDLEAALGSLREVVGGVVAAARAVATGSDESAAAADQAHHAVEMIARSASEIAQGAGMQADRIASATTAIEELARAAQQIAAAAEHQTSALGETASGIEGLDAGIAVLSEHGAGLADVARAGADRARAGAEAVAQSRDGMRRLHDASSAWSASIDALVRRSSDAAAIVRTIEAIADQSNLLALNAAIEAARAGEHGRGFAVVADEVRKFAERSANATREVGEILGAMHGETEQATVAITRAGASMDDNVRIAEATGAALDDVAASAQRTDAVAHDVAKRADDMRVASLRITSAIGSVSSAVEENAAAAAQMRATTHEITTVMVPIAHDSERQNAAAAAAASATGELAVGIGEIEAATRSLRDQALALDRLVARFTLDAEAPPEAEHRLPRFPLELHALTR